MTKKVIRIQINFSIKFPNNYVFIGAFIKDAGNKQQQCQINSHRFYILQNKKKETTNNNNNK